jgi:hypothetical protein
VKINAALTPFIRPIGELVLDPANERLHGERNVQTIIASLTLYGQQIPVVCNPKGVVLKGNGTLVAARQMGATQIAAIEAGLADALEERGFAIADNRSGELAEWDWTPLSRALQEINDSQEIEWGVTDIGWTEDEFRAMTSNYEWEGLPKDQPPAATSTKPTIRLVIEDEAKVGPFIEELEKLCARFEGVIKMHR